MQLTTIAQVLEALGGSAKVRQLTNAKSYQVVWDWKRRGCFPSKFFVVMNKALAEQGVTAPISLWQMHEKKAG